jgi:hypothetical protein
MAAIHTRLLGNCFCARRIGNGQDGDGRRGVRGSDGTEHALFQIGLTADMVDDALLDGIAEEAVHGEVAPFRILLSGGKSHALGMAAIFITAVRAKRGHLDMMLTVSHDDYTEVRPDGEGSRKQCDDLIGRGTGGDIEVLWLTPEQQIPDAAARKQGLMTGVAEFLDDACGGGKHGSG